MEWIGRGRAGRNRDRINTSAIGRSGKEKTGTVTVQLVRCTTAAIFLVIASSSCRIVPTATCFSPIVPPLNSIRTAKDRTATLTPMTDRSARIYPSPPSPSSSSSRSMISNFLGGGGGNDESGTSSTLPRDVKEAVSKCRASVQAALEKRTSRMEVNFPVGTKFGVEAAKDKRGRTKKSGPAPIDDAGANTPTRDDFDTSDRELALLFVEMFQAVGGGAISVVYRDAALAGTAVSRWKGDVGAECKVLSVDRKGAAGGKKKKKKKAVGFAAKMAEEMEDEGRGSGPFRLPDGCEVALFIAPGPKELIAVRRVCEEVGMGTLVVLLNARMFDYGSGTADGAPPAVAGGEDDLFFKEEFEPVFHLSSAPQEVAPGCLVHRSFPDGWILARKPKVGPPKTFASFAKRPTGEECRVAYEGVEIGDLEQGVESALENVASWFS